MLTFARYPKYNKCTTKVNWGDGYLDIEYRNNKMRKICCDAQYAEKMYGRENMEKIHLRLDQIEAADTVEMLIQYRIGRCHALSMNRKGQYEMDLVHPYRLVFEKKGHEIQIAYIVEIVDYH